MISFVRPRTAIAVFAFTAFTAFTALIAILSATLSTGCSSSTKSRNSSEPSARVGSHTGPSAKTGTLTRKEAATRSHQIGRVEYDLSIDLTPALSVDETSGQPAAFTGEVTLRFVLKGKAPDYSSDLIVDFAGGEVLSLAINEQPAWQSSEIQEAYDGRRLILPVKRLSDGKNTVKISFRHPFSRGGNGLHWFKDSTDQRTYVYSDLEPFDANQIFPSFDQPDLKATYLLNVQAPNDWTVIANTRESSVKASKESKLWSFPKTKPFSTYVFALHAGPYKSWSGTATTKRHTIPLRLFARQSLAAFVEPQEWFKTTQQGFEFFEEKFATPYPYVKYDQLIVPEFNAGAMENVAAVTFSERYVSRTQVTQDFRRRRAEVILHEMAHMWFGNLVTMLWWNGLWLNESFATFAAAWATHEATQIPGSWQAFFADDKQWAYWEDQLVTTHPIEVPVEDTSAAFANFDGITYGKGASVLKQLAYYIGIDAFTDGLQRYFHRFSETNTSLSDFIDKLSEASDEDLKSWQRQWLLTAGLGTLRADWECQEDDKGRKWISRFELVQGGEPLRAHRTQVGMFLPATKPGQPDHLEFEPLTDVVYVKERTPVRSFYGKRCPIFVFPNVEDHDYAKVELDPVSLAWAVQNLSRIPDSFLRQMLWHTLWEMVIDGKLKAQTYAEAVFRHIEREKDTQVVSKVIRTLHSRSTRGHSVTRILDGAARETHWARTETFLRKLVTSAPAGSDLQLVAFGNYLSAARSPEQLNWVRGLLKGSVKIRGLNMDQERRWMLVHALSASGADDTATLIEAERKRDPSDLGLRRQIVAQALSPRPEIKDVWKSHVLAFASGKGLPKDLSPSLLREAMRSIHVTGQDNWSASILGEATPLLNQLQELGDEEFSESFAESFLPTVCDPNGVERLGSVARKAHDGRLDASPSVVKALRVHEQEAKRCVIARSLSREDEAKPDSGQIP